MEDQPTGDVGICPIDINYCDDNGYYQECPVDCNVESDSYNTPQKITAFEVLLNNVNKSSNEDRVLVFQEIVQRKEYELLFNDKSDWWYSFREDVLSACIVAQKTDLVLNNYKKFVDCEDKIINYLYSAFLIDCIVDRPALRWYFIESLIKKDRLMDECLVGMKKESVCSVLCKALKDGDWKTDEGKDILFHDSRVYSHRLMPIFKALNYWPDSKLMDAMSEIELEWEKNYGEIICEYGDCENNKLILQKLKKIKVLALVNAPLVAEIVNSGIKLHDNENTKVQNFINNIDGYASMLIKTFNLAQSRALLEIINSYRGHAYKLPVNLEAISEKLICTIEKNTKFECLCIAGTGMNINRMYFEQYKQRGKNIKFIDIDNYPNRSSGHDQFWTPSDLVQCCKGNVDEYTLMVLNFHGYIESGEGGKKKQLGGFSGKDHAKIDVSMLINKLFAEPLKRGKVCTAIYNSCFGGELLKIIGENVRILAIARGQPTPYMNNCIWIPVILDMHFHNGITAGHVNDTEFAKNVVENLPWLAVNGGIVCKMPISKLRFNPNILFDRKSFKIANLYTEMINDTINQTNVGDKVKWRVFKDSEKKELKVIANSLPQPSVDMVHRYIYGYCDYKMNKNAEEFFYSIITKDISDEIQKSIEVGNIYDVTILFAKTLDINDFKNYTSIFLDSNLSNGFLSELCRALLRDSNNNPKGGSAVFLNSMFEYLMLLDLEGNKDRMRNFCSAVMSASIGIGKLREDVVKRIISYGGVEILAKKEGKFNGEAAKVIAAAYADGDFDALAEIFNSFTIECRQMILKREIEAGRVNDKLFDYVRTWPLNTQKTFQNICVESGMIETLMKKINIFYDVVKGDILISAINSDYLHKINDDGMGDFKNVVLDALQSKKIKLFVVDRGRYVSTILPMCNALSVNAGTELLDAIAKLHTLYKDCATQHPLVSVDKNKLKHVNFQEVPRPVVKTSTMDSGVCSEGGGVKNLIRRFEKNQTKK